MQKRRFKWIAAACSLLLVASTGATAASQMWNSIPVAGAYEISFENGTQLQEEYTLGASLTIPTGSIEGEAASSCLVKFPSGRVSNTAIIELTELGIYTVTWYATKNGQTVSATKDFTVTQGAYTINGGVTWDEIKVNPDEEKTGLEKHPGMEGIKLTFEPESTFYYNKAVNLKENGGDLARVYPFFGMKDLKGSLEKLAVPDLTDTDKKNIQATFEYEDEARNYLITLTDCYDSSNYVTIDLEWMEGKTRWNFSASPAGQVAHGLRGPIADNKISEESIHIGDAYYRVDKAPSEGHINANIVDAYEIDNEICGGGFELRYDVETNCVYITYTKMSISREYDETGKLVYTPEYTREEKLIADLDNEKIYPKGKFKGFATGEVYLSFTAKNFTGNEAHMEISSIGGLTGSEMLSDKGDTTKPLICLDETMKKMDTIALNEEIAIPDATALDLNLPYGTKANVAVYYLYDPGKTNVSEPLTADNKFTPTNVGAYTVVYTAKDAYGNERTEPVVLSCMEGSNNKAIDMTVDATLQVEAGSSLTIEPPAFNSASFYKDASAVKVSVTDENGKSVAVENNQVFLGGVMDYTITYTYETPYKTYTVSTKVTAVASSNVAFEMPVLPEYFIKGATYTLDDVIAYTFTTKDSVKQEATVSLIAFQEDGTSTETQVDIKAVQIPACKTLQFKYAYGGVEEYSEKIKVLDVAYDSEDGKISMIDYFHDEAGVFTKDSSSMRYVTDGTAKDATLKYINVLSLPKFTLDFFVERKVDDVPTYATPSAVVVTLIDYYNRDNQLQIRLTENKGDGTAKVELNGQSFGVTTTKFVDAKMSILYAGGKLTVGNLICSVEPNFTSAKMLLTIELQKLTGQTSLRIAGLCDKKFAAGRENRATPDIYISQTNTGYHEIGDVITIAIADISDILSPYLESGLTVVVKGPNKLPVTSLDGVRLDGTAPANREYQVKLEQVGDYEIQYTYTNERGLSNRFTSGPTILNSNAPVLLVEGKKDGQQIKAALGETIQTAPYTVSDDDTATKEIKHWCSVVYPSGTQKLFNSGASFVATETGLYTIFYVAYDEVGNTTTFTYTVKVS